eukprot:scaffold23287_cov175-Amphora_coffeaeformis.AAC.2
MPSRPLNVASIHAVRTPTEDWFLVPRCALFLVQRSNLPYKFFSEVSRQSHSHRIYDSLDEGEIELYSLLLRKER